MSLPFRLDLLGVPVLQTADGSEIALPGGKPGALLVFVACHRGPVDREEAAALFWPGPGNARQSLRQALSLLRSRLGVDLFQDRRSLHLTAEAVRLDLNSLEQFQTADDAARLAGLVRGPLCDVVDFSHSPGLQTWFVDLSKRVSEELVSATQRVAGDLLASGRGHEVDGLIRSVARSGLSEAALRRSLDGVASWTASAASSHEPHLIAAAGEPTLLEGLADEGSARLVLARGSASAVREALDRVLTADGSAASSIQVPGGNVLQFAQCLAQLLDRLGALPGGAGCSRATDAFRALLSEDAVDADSLGTDAVAALDDALDAVLAEAPLMLDVPMEDVPLPMVELLARVLAGRAFPGLAVVAHAGTPAALTSVAAGSLAASVRDVRRVDLEPSTGPGPLPLGTGPVRGIRARLPGWSRRPWILWTVAASAILGLGLDPALNVLSSDPAESPPPDFAYVTCSDADGSDRLYFSPRPGESVERISIPGNGICLRDFAVWVADRKLLIARGYREGPDGREGGPFSFVLMAFEPDANPRADWRGGEIEATAHLQEIAFSINPLHADRWLAFGATDPDGREGIFVLDLETQELRQITGTSNESYFAPRVSDAAVIWDRRSPRLYWRSFNGSSYDLWSMDWPEGEPRLFAAVGTDLFPAAVLGDTLVVERGPVGDREDGSLEIGYMFVGDPTRFDPITRNAWNDVGARVSPDGTKICWHSEEFGHYRSNVRVHDRRTGETRVLARPGRQGNCGWAPDSRGLLFNDHRPDGLHRVFLEEGFTEPWYLGRDFAHSVHVVAFIDSLEP